MTHLSAVDSSLRQSKRDLQQLGKLMQSLPQRATKSVTDYLQAVVAECAARDPKLRSIELDVEHDNSDDPPQVALYAETTSRVDHGKHLQRHEAFLTTELPALGLDPRDFARVYPAPVTAPSRKAAIRR